MANIPIVAIALALIVVTLGALVNQLRYERSYLFIHRDVPTNWFGVRPLSLRLAHLLTSQDHEALERSRHRTFVWWGVWLILCVTAASIALLSAWILSY